jgi:demethylmenaquinone methyltransferase/2-methoxy-6-polyprenyl-1,4-benzoquinol methylase
MNDKVDTKGQREVQETDFARELFGDIASNYGWPAQVFSFGQYDRWHKRLAREVGDLSGKRVLDMCTGTGMTARRMLKTHPEAEVVAADLSPAMLEKARLNLRMEIDGGQVSFVQADAQRPPFAAESFDALVFTYLLRYVEDVPSTIAGLARLVRPGGIMASLEFGVPRNPGLKGLWTLYTRGVMPGGMYFMSRGWRRVGGFLGRSINDLYNRFPLERQKEIWEEVGIREVLVTPLSLGGAVIISGRKADGRV